MSALPPKADILNEAVKGLLLTQSGRSLHKGIRPFGLLNTTVSNLKCGIVRGGRSAKKGLKYLRRTGERTIAMGVMPN